MLLHMSFFLCIFAAKLSYSMFMRNWTPWIAMLCLLAVAALWGFKVYNDLVNREEGVEEAWTQVENQYQYRAELAPKLVDAVMEFAAQEQALLQGVVEARIKALHITVDPTNITPEQLASYQAAQGELSRALRHLLAVTDKYPKLKANEHFCDIVSQLERTENRIAIARQQFNDSAKKYNKKVRRIPGNVVAAMFGFEKVPYFEAEELGAGD